MLSESMQLYMKARAGKEQWDDVEGAFSLGYEQNSRSQIAPFFKLFEADAVLEQGRKKEALAMIESGIGEIPKDNPLISLYQVKVALIYLDSEDKIVKNKGVEQLEKLAEDACAAQALALYYLGSYYWQEGQTEKAQNLWTKLPAEQEGEFSAPAPLRALVANKIS